MKSTLLKICVFSLCLVLLSPVQSKAAKEPRLALIIGNSSYQSGPLKNPVNDATDMAAMLKKLGFTVILKKNANLEEMEGAVEDFGNRLKRGGVGLFYYAGHGLQVGGVNYLVPVGAKINKESDIKYKAVDAGRVLDEMANANNGLNIVILDACRDNPFSRSFRSATRGLAIISNAPSGTFISYSTGANQVARDGEGRNSPYTKVLLENIDRSGLSINDVFMKVRSRVKKESGQIPWELSSLEGNFFFIPGSVDSKSTGTDKLDEENRKLKEEQRRLEAEKAELEQKLRSEEDKRLAPSQAKAPGALNDWLPFAGQWYGRWSNNLGESGDD
ncbi:MAG TPA: caspase family protein [Syntrophales bacterium]|nr:caspase family protein [Syntrophales bacterium]